MERKDDGKSKKLRDNHIHIGQFEEMYYDPKQIFDIVLSAGVEEIAFTSTTTCITEISYTIIENEIRYATNGSFDRSNRIIPYLWYIPAYITQGVTPQNAFDSIPYQGIKLHPFAHMWDFENSKHLEALNKICEFAMQKEIPILIHTGMSRIDRANRFEKFIKIFNKVKFILAHCRPLDQTISMLQNYKNVFCDSSFVCTADIQTIFQLGFRNRVIFGTDFPITYHWNSKYLNAIKNISLAEQYLADIKDINVFEQLNISV